MVLPAEHEIQGEELDPDPPPPTLHITKPTHLRRLIPNPTPNSTHLHQLIPNPNLNPTHLHPLDMDPTLPDLVFCNEVLKEISNKLLLRCH